MESTALDGKPHARIDEGDAASAKPRSSSLLCKKIGLLMCPLAVLPLTGRSASAPTDWTGGGGNTLVSTVENWAGGAVPTTNMRFPASMGQTVTFDATYSLSSYFWVGTDTANVYWNSTTDEFNPVVFEATGASFGINQAKGQSFGVGGDGAGANGALWIKNGTYRIGSQLQIGTGASGFGWMQFDEGTITTVDDVVMGSKIGAVGRLTIGSGDAGRLARMTVPTGKWVVMTGHANGDGRITLKAGGELHCAYVNTLNPAAGLTFDGGTLVKDGDIFNQVGYLYGGGVDAHAGDPNTWIEITSNGGTIDVGACETRIDGAIRPATGATDYTLVKRGTGALTLSTTSAFAGTFRVEAGSLNLVSVGTGAQAVLAGGSGAISLASGAFSRLEISGGTHRIDKLPAHVGQTIVSGGYLLVPANDAELTDGVPFRTAVKASDYQFTDGRTAAEVFRVFDTPKFLLSVTVDAEGCAVLHPTARPSLPAEYMPIEYLESTGTQYVMTDYIHTSATRVECTVNVAGTPVQTWPGVFGTIATDSSHAHAFFFISHQNKATKPNMGRSGKQLSPTAGNAFIYDERVTLVCEGVHSEWRRADEVTRVGFCDATGGTVDGGTYPLVIFGFGIPTNGKYDISSNSYAKMKLYEFKIFEGESLSADYRPCRSADGILGLYETVSGRFYPNSGKGEFLCEHSGIEGMRLDYLESTGTQYVMTDYVHSPTTRVECTVNVAGTPVQTWPGVFGTIATDSSHAHAFFFISHQNKAKKPNMGRSGKQLAPTAGNAFIYDEKIELVCSGVHSEWRRPGDAVAAGFCDATGGAVDDGAYPLVIFGFGVPTNGKYGISSNSYAKMKLYDFKIYEGETLAAHYVPWRLTNGVAGLLDLMTGKFFSNAGTGAFGQSQTPETFTGLRYSDGIWVAKEGTLGDVEPLSSVTKIGTGTLDIGSMTAIAKLTVSEGVLSLQDGTVREVGVAGALKLTGGTTIRLDVTDGGADSFRAGSVELVDASSAHPVTIDLRFVAGTDRDFGERTLIASGVNADVLDRFAVTGAAATLAVCDGALVVRSAARSQAEAGTRLVYLESTGTQVVLTDYIHRGKSRAVCVAEISSTQVVPKGFAGLFGLCGAKVASTPGSWTFITTDNGNLHPSYGRTNQHNQNPVGDFVYDEPVQVTCDSLHSEWCRWGGNEVLGTCDIANGILDSGLNPLYIFAFGFNDGTYRVSPNSYSCMKLYSIRFYEGENLVRDFVPWRRGDGVLGLMDLVNSRFFPNAGTGDFTAGPDAFPGAIEAHGAALSIQSGTIDAVDAEGVGEVVKIGAGEANAVSVPVFPSLKVAGGTLSFQNATNDEVVVLGKLTLMGGATLALDCTSEMCDLIRPGSVDLTEASASNRVVLEMALPAEDDLSARGVKVIASGLRPGDEMKFRAIGGTRKFQVAVEDGALYVCHRRGLTVNIR